ncbi:hypothetical protein BT69DRAFT_1158081 [Atractiella rhizophila]|nr:hypothetical protein BT69DRAFT_1158081 [Atractiella rhizophila]
MFLGREIQNESPCGLLFLLLLPFFLSAPSTGHPSLWIEPQSGYLVCLLSILSGKPDLRVNTASLLQLSVHFLFSKEQGNDVNVGTSLDLDGSTVADCILGHAAQAGSSVRRDCLPSHYVSMG